MTDNYPTALDDDSLAETWASAWAAIGRPAPPGLLAELITAWSTPHRHYHDLRHLRQCLAFWSRWREHSPRPGEVAIALWFHDAIYDPQSHDNELNSAAWAARSLARAGADSDTAQRVYDLVMVTGHDAPATHALGLDAQLLVDIDLSILGSPAERFAQYDQDVRKEYARAPGLRYQEARAKVLRGLLDRRRLYHGKHAVALLEAQAHINLTAALSRLAQ